MNINTIKNIVNNGEIDNLVAIKCDALIYNK